MAQHDSLFTLIKSLSKGEKRHFKSHSTVPGVKEPAYVTLFNLLDKAGDYDKPSMMKKLGGSWNDKSFSDLKTYLFDALLENLHLFRASTYPAQQSQGLLNGATVLYRKGLYPESQKLLNKARRIAIRIEDAALLLAIGRLEYMMIADHRSPSHSLPKAIKQLEEEAILIEQIRLRNKPTTQSVRLHNLVIGKGIISELEYEAAIAVILNDPDMALASASQQRCVLAFYYDIHSSYASLNGDYQGAYENCKKRYELYYNDMVFISESFRLYLIAAHNYMMYAAAIGHWDEVRDALELLGGVAPKSIDNETYQFEIYNIFRVQLSNQTADFTGTGCYVSEIEAGLGKFEGKLNHLFELYLYNVVSVFFFMQGDYGGALDWTNKYLQSEFVKIDPKTMPLVELFRLLIFYELGNFELLTYEMRRVDSLIKKQKVYLEFAGRLIANLKAAASSKNKKEQMAVFEGMRNGLSDLKNDAIEAPAFGQFHWLEWAKSKATGNSLIETVKRQLELDLATSN